MGKIKKFLSAAFLASAVGLVGCATFQDCSSCNSSRTSVLQRNAFVKIESYAIFMGKPTRLGSGSGAFIKHQDGKSYILTAGHICDKETVELPGGVELEVKLRAVDVKGNYYALEVDEISMNSDLCLLETDGVNKPTLKLAAIPPQIGDSAFNFSAARGIFEKGMVLLFHGHYSGDMTIRGLFNLPRKSSVYTIPTKGGSSGSPVMNEAGELIGVLYAARQDIEHLGLSVTYKQVKSFLDANLNMSKPDSLPTTENLLNKLQNIVSEI